MSMIFDMAESVTADESVEPSNLALLYMGYLTNAFHPEGGEGKNTPSSYLTGKKKFTGTPNLAFGLVYTKIYRKIGLKFMESS